MPRWASGTGSPALGKVLLGMSNGNMLAAVTQEAEGARKVAKTSLTSFLTGASSKIVGPALSPPRPWVFRKQNIMGKIVTETRYNNKTVLWLSNLVKLVFSGSP